MEYRRLLLRLAARDLSHGVGVDDIAAELSDLAAGTLEAALAIARTRVGEQAAAARIAVVAMGKCGGHELNYVSDVDVIFVVEPAEGHDEHAAIRAGTMLASNLMRICSRPHRRGHDLAGRRGAAPRGQVRAAGPHAREPPGLLREVGQDLGVPGAAQGAAGGRRPRARPRSTSRRSRRWCGRPPSARASSPTSRRCAAACSSTSPQPRRSGRSSSARAACATWSSRSSCCSSCTGAATRRSAPPRR